MPFAWRTKAITAVLALALAVYFILPNFMSAPPEKDQPDKRPWFERMLPRSAVRLGLDLQGGIHMVLGIDLQRALYNEADRLMRDLREFAPERGVEISSVERSFDETELKVQLKNVKDDEKFEKFIQNEFSVLVVTDRNAKEGTFVLNIDPQKKSQIEQGTVEQALQTLRNRLDEFGVAEPSIQAQGKDRIIVQLPGMDDPQRARNVLGRTAQLEFRIVEEESMPPQELELLVREAKKTLPAKFSSQDLTRTLRDKLPPNTVVMMKEEKDPTTGSVSQMPSLVKAEAPLTGDMLEDARIGQDEYNMPTVNLVFNPRGTQILDQLTGDSIGRKLAIILDDVIQSDPVIRSKISNGRPQITFGQLKTRNETLQEAKDLSMVLRAGALPAPVEVLENRTVGPSLGRDSIERGMKAILIGVLMVVIFMAIYYQLAGVMADFAVIVNVLFTLACLGALHATLTLPGLAGILISVGMAVDANVIIYERIREELRAGKSIKSAVEAGYDRAHLTIIDSNLTTIITAVVLLQYGTGPIKGFAVTLILGLIANYFTALWLTRIGFEWILHKFELKRLSI